MTEPTRLPTSVYRYYDKFDLLLYVGITSRGAIRNAEHYSTKSWWPYVVRQEVDHLPTRPAALARERELIAHFRPPFNTQHNHDSAALRAAYVAMRQRGDSPVKAALRAGVADPRVVGRNRLQLDVSQVGDRVRMSLDPTPLALQWDEQFPVAGGKLIWVSTSGNHFMADAKVRKSGQVLAASLMYRNMPNRLVIKRIDLEVTA